MWNMCLKYTNIILVHGNHFNGNNDSDNDSDNDVIMIVIMIFANSLMNQGHSNSYFKLSYHQSNNFSQ